MAFARVRKWLARQIAPKPNKPGRGGMRSAYDAAQDGPDADHWRMADSLNANAANSPGVRKTLRERARYECQSNGYAGDLVNKFTRDHVGACPRIQIAAPDAPRKALRAVEKSFAKWAKETGLGEKLRLLDAMAVRDGEGFAVLGLNPAFEGVQLDLKLFEPDQVTTPFMDWMDLRAFDGGKTDEHGNVVEWHFLKAHPGSNLWLSAFLEVDVVPAKNVIQWFRPTRAGQLRGIPEIMSALTLYAYLRRYTLATVTSAELAASIAGVIEVEGTLKSDGTPMDVALMEEIPMPRGSMLTVPKGSQPRGFDPTHPTSTYPQFKSELLTEAGTSVGAPQNVSTASSAAYNYSSAQMDMGIYRHGLGVRRHDFAARVLDRVFRAWLAEAALVPGLLPATLPARALWSWEWFFDGFTPIDPLKTANANQIRLQSFQTTLAELYAERGKDWEEAIEQRAHEMAMLAQCGLGTAPAPAGDAAAVPAALTVYNDDGEPIGYTGAASA